MKMDRTTTSDRLYLSRFTSSEEQPAQNKNKWKPIEKPTCSTIQADPWLALEPTPRSAGITLSKQQHSAVHPPHQRLKRQAETEATTAEEEKEEPSYARLKATHPSSLQLPTIGHLPSLGINQSEVYYPPPLSHQQVPENRNNIQHSEQFQQSYSFNEGSSPTHLAGRKKFKPQKKKRTTATPTPEEIHQWEQLYPNLANQFTMAMNEANQKLDKDNKDLGSSNKLSSLERLEEISENAKKAEAPAFKAPRAQ
jgi:uncharacterized membrane protein